MRTRHADDWSCTVYKPATWICDLDHPDMDEEDTPRFTNGTELARHVEESHKEITPDDIQTMIRHNSVLLNRPANVCPFCCYNIEDDAKPKNVAGGVSRVGKTSLSITISKDLYDIPEESGYSSSKSSLSNHVARHIAGHLNTLTVLAIRMLSIPDDGGVAENGESVAFSESSSIGDDKSSYQDWESSGDEASDEQTEPKTPMNNRELEIQGGKVKQNLFDKQKKCLQLFRLTSGDKDATYEWYKDRVENRVEGTCTWFLNHENFRKWLEQDSGSLLVSADPGCGKSVLAKYLTDHALHTLSRSPTTICYFFFKDQDQNTVRQALCALLHQLFISKPSLIEYAVEQFDKDGAGLINSTRSLWAVLENVAKDPRAGPITMVLDALDECIEPELEDLIRNLENQSSYGRFKCLFTSRPYEQIVSRFQGHLKNFPYIRIPGVEESETISQEVNHVIKYQVEKLAKQKGLSGGVEYHLAERLIGISHRTYLWVYLVFDELKKRCFQHTEEGVEYTIARLPKTVYQAYEQILDRSEEGPIVQMALKIVLTASRPLTVSEMNIALDVNTAKSINNLGLENEENFKLRLRDLCGLFVSIYHDKIYFLHPTAREFLLALPPPANAPPGARWQHSITSRDAHKALAEICVTYLDFLNSDDTPLNESTARNLERYAFLDYSANNWAAHFRGACFSDDAGIIPSILRICDPGLRSFSIWLECAANMPWETPKNLTSLLISSYFGHEAVVRLLLEKGANLESKDNDKYGRTPLSWAAEKGYKRVVKLLLEKGADLEFKDKYGRTPLLLAGENRHAEVVKLLEEKSQGRASVDDTGSVSGNVYS
ncbi:hypothetical protein GGR58DRAFT_96693 [Xylaria digitata]|nr:hypothetical protein GGR58DRAFT_96693 [Xylaria digitata]